MQVILTEEEYNEWKRRDERTQQVIAETVKRLVEDYENRVLAKVANLFAEYRFPGHVTMQEVKTLLNRAFAVTPAIQTNLEAMQNSIDAHEPTRD